jgi:hypothetical protein
MAAMRKVRWSSWPVIGLLVAAGVASMVAFVLAPAALLGGRYGSFRQEAALRDGVGRGLVEFWRAGGPEYPALLARLVDYWFRWHAIKVAISSLMLIVFVLLAAALWRGYLRGGGARAVGAIAATSFAVLAVGLLLLNIQATAVPLVALLPLLSGGAHGGDLARTLREVRDGVNRPAGPHGGSPALSVLLGEVERYHWVMVAAAGAVVLATGLASAILWRRRGAGSARAGFMRKALSVILAVTATLLLTVVAYSAYSAADPGGALLALLGGG